MTPQTLSPEYVDAQIYKKEFVKVWEKTTVCLLTLNNWFEIVGLSHVFDKDNYNEEIWQQEAYNDAFNKAVEFIAFRFNDMATPITINTPEPAMAYATHPEYDDILLPNETEENDN